MDWARTASRDGLCIEFLLFFWGWVGSYSSAFRIRNKEDFARDEADENNKETMRGGLGWGGGKLGPCLLERGEHAGNFAAKVSFKLEPAASDMFWSFVCRLPSPQTIQAAEFGRFGWAVGDDPQDDRSRHRHLPPELLPPPWGRLRARVPTDPEDCQGDGQEGRSSWAWPREPTINSHTKKTEDKKNILSQGRMDCLMVFYI